MLPTIPAAVGDISNQTLLGALYNSNLCPRASARVLLHTADTVKEARKRTYAVLLMAANLLWSKSLTRKRLLTTIHVALTALGLVASRVRSAACSSASRAAA